MIEALDGFFTSTAWTMTPPPAYGAFHILYTLIGFFVCTVLAWKLRKSSEKAFHCILFTIGLVLFLSEIYKQLFYFFVMEDNAYCWGEFPFQLCSIPMYLCLIVPFMKPGTVQKALYSFMMLFNLLGGAISFTEPSGLLHGYWFLTVHALVWHMAIVFIGLLICFRGKGGHETKDYWNAMKVFLVLCVIAFCINVTVQTVFHGDINMFFIGPGNSPIIVFKQISEWLGWYVSTALYIPAVCLGAYIIFLPIHLVRKKKAPQVI